MVTMSDGGAAPDLIEHYCAWMLAAGRSPVTIATRRRQAQRLAEHTDPTTATTYDLVAFLARPDWKPATRASERAAVRCFCRWMVDAGLRDDDPSARLPAVRVPPGVPHPAGEPALERARRLAAGPYEAAMVELAARAGLRRGEIARLTFDDLLVEPDGGYALRVRGKGGRTHVAIGT